jgi:hypothetical protein
VTTVANAASPARLRSAGFSSNAPAANATANGSAYGCASDVTAAPSSTLSNERTSSGPPAARTSAAR